MNKDESNPSDPEEIEFHLIKSSLFRTIHCDGMLGNRGPDGTIHVTVYSERIAIPTKMVVSSINGELGQELKREGRDGIVRDVEANIVLNLDTAIGLYEWLQECLEEAVADNLIDKVEPNSKNDQNE